MAEPILSLLDLHVLGSSRTGLPQERPVGFPILPAKTDTLTLLERLLRNAARLVQKDQLPGARALMDELIDLAASSQAGRALVEAMRIQGYLHQQGDEQHLAADRLRNAILLCDHLEEPDDEATLLEQLCLLHYLTGEVPHALRIGQKALILLEDRPARLENSRIHNTLGLCYSHLGHLTDALVSYARALEVSRHITCPEMESAALNNIGHVHLLLKDPSSAQTFFSECLSIKRRLSDPRGQVMCLVNLGLCDFEQGRLEPAVLRYQQALELEAWAGTSFAWAAAMENLGHAHLADNRPDLALRCYERILEDAQTRGSARQVCSAQRALGRLYLKEDYHDHAPRRAEEHLRQGLAVALELKAQDHQAEIYGLLARALKVQGKFEEALHAYEQHHLLERTILIHTGDERLRLMRMALHLELVQGQVKQAELDRRALEAALSAAERRRSRAEEARLEAERLARIDGLTGLHNRRALDERLDEELSRFRRYGSTFSLCMLDVDHFKLINDRWGHTVGDEVLKQIAQILQSNHRQSDFLARYGGEEFVMIALEASGADTTSLCERIRAAIEGHPWHELQVGLRVTASIGICEVGEVQAIIREILHLVDSRLYEAKRTGRNRVCGPPPPAPIT